MAPRRIGYHRAVHPSRGDRRGVIAVALTLAGLVGACGHTPLVRRDDPVLEASERRLARTAAAVDALQPPAPERQLFMQAEGFFRYRFEAPPRNVASALAVVAAAVTDLPAFQALAGSLDMLRPRLAARMARSISGRRCSAPPDTVLKPLTLYRLGWAYRNAGATGLPRESGDDAFDELVKTFPSSNLAALATASKAERWKSKDTATGLSLLPGLRPVLPRPAPERHGPPDRRSRQPRHDCDPDLRRVPAPQRFVLVARLAAARDGPRRADPSQHRLHRLVSGRERGVVEYNERVEADFRRAIPRRRRIAPCPSVGSSAACLRSSSWR